MNHVNIYSGTNIESLWPQFKNVLDGTDKELLGQYEEDSQEYLVFAIDGPMLYMARIYKAGFEPSSFSAQDIIDNTSYREDFIDNFQSLFNRQIS